ncbi:PIN domain-like protein, partial [Lentinula raphanica]
MGVAGLWPLLEPAQSVTTLSALSLTKFNTTSRGYRIGIDASIWFFHAEYGKAGENPELRTIFFRCAQLLRQGFLPLFVFDGPLRPDIKRGKMIHKSAHKLVAGMQAIIEAFGFEYRTAPGEAEAELAFLNRVGIIDGILSDDVDNFLFGAHTVVRNHSSTHAGAKSAIEKAKVYTYTLPHPALPNFGREELIFIALCSGGDYGPGLDNCGIKISYSLARAGFGKSLCQAALNHHEQSAELRDSLSQWKKHLAHELETNASGFLPRKSPKLASAIPETFPDIKVLLAYLKPTTSESLGRLERYDDLQAGCGSSDGWLKKDPSLPMLAEKCEFYFEWGFMESIVKRFRTVIFQGVALRFMRRACILRQTTSCRDGEAVDFDIIRSHFASGFHIEDHKPSCPALVKDISRTRKHESTSMTLEYRVAINPIVLVDLTILGVKGTRRPDYKDEWAEFEEAAVDPSDNEGATRGKSKQNGYSDPALPLKLWLPAVVIKEAIPDAVEAYEEAQKHREEEKAGKGK